MSLVWLEGKLNAYASLTQIKGELGITATTNDTTLLRMLEAASRMIDLFCNRFFYVREGVKYFDGGCPLFISDLLSIDTDGFVTDEDGDLDYDNTLATTDYILYPLNEFPKTYIQLDPDSNYGGFGGAIRKGVKITGKWGYGNGISATPYKATAITGTVATTDGTTLTLSADGTIEAGHTILCETEQIYVIALGTLSATVKRGVNGTDGAIHSTKALSIYQYPDDIIQICLMLSERLYATRGKVFQSEKLGDYTYTLAEGGMVDIQKAILLPYKRI